MRSALIFTAVIVGALAVGSMAATPLVPRTHKVSVTNNLDRTVRVRSIGTNKTWTVDLKRGETETDRNHSGGERVFVVWDTAGKILTYEVRMVNSPLDGKILKSDKYEAEMTFGYGNERIPRLRKEGWTDSTD